MTKASDDVKHKRAIQGAMSIGTATIGLAALGTKGASMALKRSPKMIRRLPKSISSDSLNRGSISLTTAGAGLGGASGYHFAALQRAENKAERQREGKVNKMLEYSPFGVVSKAKWDDDSAMKTAQMAGYGGAAAGLGGAVAANEVRGAVNQYRLRGVRAGLSTQKKKMKEAEKKATSAQKKAAKQSVPGQGKYDIAARKQTKKFYGASNKAMKLVKTGKKMKDALPTAKVRAIALGVGGVSLAGSEIARQNRVQKNDWWSDSN
jgi:hypothetical protein